MQKKTNYWTFIRKFNRIISEKQQKQKNLCDLSFITLTQNHKWGCHQHNQLKLCQGYLSCIWILEVSSNWEQKLETIGKETTASMGCWRRRRTGNNENFDELEAVAPTMAWRQRRRHGGSGFGVDDLQGPAEWRCRKIGQIWRENVRVRKER